jgi:SAM-dependent methyltransferase
MFFDWLEKIGYISPESRLSILDLGTGPGANLSYMAKRYPLCKFIGVDLNPDHVKRGNKILSERQVYNAHIVEDDWYNLGSIYKDNFDGVINFQTLSWLPEFREPTEAICKLNPRWIALTSLFYNGLVSATTDTTSYDERMNVVRNLHYNVYSIPVFKKFLCSNGYMKFRCTPFEIDIDIPNVGEFRTYTERTYDGRRIQISGPVFLPWHFVAAERGVA